MHIAPNDNFHDDDTDNPLAFVVPNFWTNPCKQALSWMHPKLTICGNPNLETMNENIIGVTNMFHMFL